MIPSPTAPLAMIVDSRPQRAKHLEVVLGVRGYRVSCFLRGDLVLRAASSRPPDVILLGITMPGMGGYEICRLLKEDDELKDIPVIFISGSDETVDKARAFGIGGVDLITEPFHSAEVKARVHTHVRLRLVQHELQEKCKQLTELVELRHSSLRDIVHDLKNPLNAIIGYLQLLQEAPHGQLDERQMSFIDKALAASQKLLQTVDSLLGVGRIEQVKMAVSK